MWSFSITPKFNNVDPHASMCPARIGSPTSGRHLAFLRRALLDYRAELRLLVPFRMCILHQTLKNKAKHAIF